MSTVTKPVLLDETFADKMDALSHLISHQNAAIDLIASDKRASLVTDVATVAELCRNGEILEVMDYGDQITPAWTQDGTSYNPALNLCHEDDAVLEDGEVVHGAYWEWDKLTPVGIPFDAPEAIYVFDGTEAAGTYYITIGASYGSGWVTGQSIQITLTDAPAEGDQLVISLAQSYDTNPTAGRTWTVYGKGSTTAKQSGTTSNGTSGTQLGSTNATSAQKTNGSVNAPSRCVYGYNRWAKSALRQYLNSSAAADAWWTPQHDWDRPPAQAATVEGFLHGYEEAASRYFLPVKVVTVACDADDNVEDITYDKVFLSSLEQMYCVPQFSGKEGAYWEYYKRLLGRTTPAPTGASHTYARLKKYALDAPTSAQACWRRSAYRAYSHIAWYVNASGVVGSNYAYSANRCAPGVFLSV